MQLLNSTQVPNTLLEAIYVKNSVYTEREGKMLLYICRKTIGWQKETDWLTLARIKQDTGQDKGHSSPILASLQKKGAIIREKRAKGWVFSLNPVMWSGSMISEKVTDLVTESYRSGNHSITKETNTKDDEASSPVLEDFNFPDYLLVMEHDPKKAIRLIAIFFRKKHMVFASKKQVQLAIKRHITIARAIVEFNPTRKQIGDAFAACDAMTGIPWTLETIYKCLTNPLTP